MALTSFPFNFLLFKTCPAPQHLSSAGLYAEWIPKKMLCVQRESRSVPLCPGKLFFWLKYTKSPPLEVLKERVDMVLVAPCDLGGLSNLSKSIML